MPKNNVIKNVKELIKLSQHENGCECYIRLKFGIKSSKIIRWMDDIDKFHIIHEIDDSESIVSPNQLKTTIIGEAIEKGALIAYESS